MKMTRIAKLNIPSDKPYVGVAVRCPVCHKGRLMDAAEGTDVSQMRLFGAEPQGKCQWYMKCPKCGRQIGIVFGRARREPDKVEFAH